MRKVKPALIILITTIFVIASSFPFASVVLALCSGAGCNNTDPGTTGCNADAATVRTMYPASGKARVELRYSDECQTRWSKVFNIASINYWGMQQLDIGITIQYILVLGSRLTLTKDTVRVIKLVEM